jgi:hypothetical protein
LGPSASDTTAAPTDVRCRGERHGPAFPLSDDEMNAPDLCRQSLRRLRLPVV